MIADIFTYGVFLATGYLLGGQFDQPWLGALVVSVLLYLWHLNCLRNIVNFLQSGSPPRETFNHAWNEICVWITRLRDDKAQTDAATGLQNFQTSITTLPFGAVRLGINNHIEWFNDQAAQMIDLKNQDIGRNITHLLRHPDFSKSLNNNQSNEAVMLNYGARKLMVFASLLQNKRLIIIQDVTRLHHLEKIRRELLSNMSHELRSPLTVIKGYAEILKNVSLSEQGQSAAAVTEITRHVEQMEQIINDAMSLERLEDSPLTAKELETIDVAQLVDEVSDSAKILFVEKQLTIEKQINSSVRLEGSVLELRSAFFNLLHNALRYSPKHGKVILCWQADHSSGHFSVSDEGCGIAAEHIPHLTERLYRVDEGRPHDTGGTGLGLAIVKHVLRRHNAKLHITSTLGRGSVFRCDFSRDSLRFVE